MPKKPSQNSSLTQEQETIFALLASFTTVWEQRRDYYFKGAMQESLNKEKHAELRAEFSKYQIDYDGEVFPLFFSRLDGFLHLWASRKAATDTIKDYQKWLKPYHSAVRLITQPNAPFPQKWKEQWEKMNLKDWPPPPPTLENALLREGQQHIEQDQGIKILDINIKKDPGKHPVWQQLQVELFQTLHKKDLSERESYELIARLLTTLLPAWFPSEKWHHHADRIRLSVKRRLKKT